jgi:hypothetical protein
VSRAALALAVLACTGCFEVTTAEVRVRDTSRVEVQSSKTGETVLGAGATDAVLQRDTYWQVFSREPYEVRASRDSSGAVSLTCEACADPGFPYTGTRDITILDPSGRSLPTLSWSLGVEPTRVVADYQVCMIQGRHSCPVSTQARLVAPMDDVVEVRRRTEPVRVWGYLLLAVSGAMLAAMSWYTFAPHPGTSFEDRAPWGLAGAVPAFALGGVGLWEVLAPVHEQVWRPPGASE